MAPKNTGQHRGPKEPTPPSLPKPNFGDSPIGPRQDSRGDLKAKYSHIGIEYGNIMEYFVEQCQSHTTLLWI